METLLRRVPLLVALASVWLVAHASANPGDQFKLSPAELPAPYSTPPNDISPDFEGEKAGFLPSVPTGFSVSAFASRPQLKNPRRLAVAPNGDVFVAESGPGKITVLRDTDGDGKADIV